MCDRGGRGRSRVSLFTRGSASRHNSELLSMSFTGDGCWFVNSDQPTVLVKQIVQICILGAGEVVGDAKRDDFVNTVDAVGVGILHCAGGAVWHFHAQVRHGQSDTTPTRKAYEGRRRAPRLGTGALYDFDQIPTLNGQVKQLKTR